MVSKVIKLGVVLLLIAGQAEGAMVLKELSKEDLATMAIIERDPVGGVGITNSRMRFTTPGIEEIANQGIDVVPQVVRIMEHPETSFDTFVRCYGVCQAIITKVNPAERILWYRKVRTKFTKKRGIRFLPLGPVEDFRKQVIGDIRKKLMNADDSENEQNEHEKDECSGR